MEDTEKENAPVPLSGGSADGMPTWADYMKMLEAEGDLAPPAPKPTAGAVRKTAVPAKGEAELAEEAEKARKRKEEQERRRKEMRDMMNAGKAKRPATSEPKVPLTETNHNSPPAETIQKTSVETKEIQPQIKPDPEKIPIASSKPIQERVPTEEKVLSPVVPEPVTPVSLPKSQPEQKKPIDIQPSPKPQASALKPEASVAPLYSQTAQTSHPPLRNQLLEKLGDFLSDYENQLKQSVLLSKDEENKKLCDQLQTSNQEANLYKAKYEREVAKNKSLTLQLNSQTKENEQYTKLIADLIAKLESLS